MAIRLNANKPTQKNPGLPSAKNGSVRLMRAQDVIKMPPTDYLGVACLGDFELKPDASFQFLYLTPKTQKYEINPTGDVDERLFKKKVFGSYPGNDLQIFEFIKNNINQGYILVYTEDCEPYSKIFGSPKNPLFLSPNYKSDSTGKGFELTLEQNTSDNIPVLFYNGAFPVIIEESGIVEIIDIIGQPIEGPYQSRRIYLVDAEPTGIDLDQFAYPVIFRVVKDGKSTDVTYDESRNRYAQKAAELPPGTNRQIYEIDNALPEKVKPTNRLTDVETALANEITVRRDDDLAEKTARENADIAEANARTFANGILDGKITTEKNRNDAQDLTIAAEKTRNDAQDTAISANAAAIGNKQDKSLFSSLTANFLHYYSATGKFLSSGVELVSDAFLKLKAISFSGYTIAQRDALGAVAEGTLIYVTDVPKGFQKRENGAWISVGANIGNSDLTNLVARKFTQAAAYTHDTMGNSYFLKGIRKQDIQNTNYKRLVAHVTTGEVLYRDGIDGFEIVSGIQNATTQEKSSMRVALLGTAVPPTPVVNVVNTWYIRRGVEKMLILSGVNLTPLDPVSIWIESGGVKVFATNYFTLGTSALQTFWNIPIDFPLGVYGIKLTFGAVTQGASPGVVRVLENGSSLDYTFLNGDLKRGFRSNGTVTGTTPTAILSNNRFRLSKLSTTYTTIDDSLDSAVKTPNIFKGALTSSWEIILNITAVSYNTGGSNSHIAIILTETTNAQFTNIDNLIFNHVLGIGVSRQTIFNPLSQVVFFPPTWAGTGYTSNVVVRKSGNKVAIYGLDMNTGVVIGYYEMNIDTTKDFALCMLDANTQSALIKEIQISATILNE